MDELLDFYKEQLQELSDLSLNLYRVIRYEIGHRTLVIMVESELPARTEHRFIMFVGVSYMKLLPSWQNAPFDFIALDDNKSFLEELGVYISDSYPKLIFQALPQNNKVMVVCSTIHVTPNMPELHSYF